MNLEELKRIWQEEESHADAGWGFLCGRYQTEPLPWDYREKVGDFLKSETRLLDMGTGNGEFLLSLGHPYELTSVTEDREPYLQLCRRWLAPLGVTVKECACGPEDTLPFPDGSFDLVLNRRESYEIGEVRRVLKPGGFFLTQQAGGQDGRSLAKRLLPNFDRPGLDFNLENEVLKFERAGFRVMYRNQAYPVGRFLDIGALCRYAKSNEREFPEFSVERCFDKLLVLQQELEQRGGILNQEHHFIVIVKKLQR